MLRKNGTLRKVRESEKMRDNLRGNVLAQVPAYVHSFHQAERTGQKFSN
jgi:hypothetical protein